MDRKNIMTELPVANKVNRREKSVMNRNTMIKIAIGVVLAALAAGVYLVYMAAFSMTKYDLSDYMTELTFSGYDGEAIAVEPRVNYDALDRLGFEEAYHLSNVLDTVEYSITPGEGLSNGDKVKVVAVYNDDYAKKYRIRLTGLKYEAVVSGALVRINPADITTELLEMAKKKGAEFIKEYMEYYDYENISSSFITSFLVSPKVSVGQERYEDDSLKMIFKVTFDDPEYYDDEDEDSREA